MRPVPNRGLRTLILSNSHDVTSERRRKAKPVRREAIPSDRAWFDARLLTLNLERTITDIVLAAGTITQVASQDPMRVQITFAAAINSIGGMSIAPWPEPDRHHLGIVTAQVAQTFKIFDFPLDVQQAWYVFDQGGGTIRIITIRRR